ncbi:MAG: flavodoxin family protein [Armatimonadota bacterium]
MKAVIIDGNMNPSPVTGAVIHCLEPLLVSGGCQVSTITLREMSVQACTMCQQCSMTGQWNCTHGDEWPSIAQDAKSADLLLLLSPISFGGHCSLMKSFLDRLLFNLSPNYMRHQTAAAPGRSSHSIARICTVGMLSGADPEQETTFTELCRRNGLSFGCLRCNSIVMRNQPAQRVILKQVRQLLDGILV